MMLNSCVFIVGLLSCVRAAINGPDDLLRMCASIPWRAVHAHLASIPIGLGAIQTPPVILFAESPSFGEGVFNRVLNLLVRVARSWSQPQFKAPLTAVNTRLFLKGTSKNSCFGLRSAILG